MVVLVLLEQKTGMYQISTVNYAKTTIFIHMSHGYFGSIKYAMEIFVLKFTKFVNLLFSNSYSYDSESLCITWPHIYWMF